MKFFIVWSILLLSIGGGLASNIPRVAVAHLSAENVVGTIRFTETSKGVMVTGFITGMMPGFYGFHIHELGDINTCDVTGAHFNPRGVNHGGRDHNIRHVGDLGNLEFRVNEPLPMSYINFTDSVISLRGSNNILGRSVVLHAQRDDYGLGGDPSSISTGNAGARVACAVIGMHAPVEAWNSSVQVIPSTVLLMLIVAVRLFQQN